MLTLLKKYNNREDGFTLIELLIVVLIIGILAAVAIPVYLGIQNQAHKSAMKSDVNIVVKRVQVALTEGANISDIKTNNTPYTQAAEKTKGETVTITDSATKPGTNEFEVTASENAANGAPLTYTYAYDSATGQFTESNTSSLPASAAPTITYGDFLNANTRQPYNVTATVTGYPAPTFTATGLPAGMNIDPTTGTVSGTPTNPDITSASGIITATNASGTATRPYAFGIQNLNNFESNNTDNSNWTYAADAFNGTPVSALNNITTAQHIDGTQSMAIPFAANKYATATYTGSGYTPGKTYSVFAYFYYPTANDTITFYTPTGGSSSSVSGQPNVWRANSLNGGATADANGKLTVVFRINSSSSTETGTGYIDAITFTAQ